MIWNIVTLVFSKWLNVLFSNYYNVWIWLSKEVPLNFVCRMKFQLRKRSECCRRPSVIWPWCRRMFISGTNISKKAENVNQIKELVQKNRRLTIRDLADTIGTSKRSLNTVLKDILCATGAQTRFFTTVNNSVM